MQNRPLHRLIMLCAAIGLATVAGTALADRSHEIASVFYDFEGNVVGEVILKCDGTTTSWGERGAHVERVITPCP